MANQIHNSQPISASIDKFQIVNIPKKIGDVMQD
jgi:hypothetical protein